MHHPAAMAAMAAMTVVVGLARQTTTQIRLKRGPVHRHRVGATLSASQDGTDRHKGMVQRVQRVTLTISSRQLEEKYLPSYLERRIRLPSCGTRIHPQCSSTGL